LQEGINRNPLDDEDYFLLAQILFNNKKFDRSKMALSKAIALNPEAIEYHSLYAKILFEVESTDAAIGYLRNLESKFIDNSHIIGDIATFYHRSGQLKQFEEYKKKVQELLVPDVNLYIFLTDVSKREGAVDDYIRYTNELLKLTPGDLTIRMNLGEFLYQRQRYDEAMSAFVEVQNRLPSYPKVNYYISTIFVLKNDLKKAEEYAKKEKEYNPKFEAGYVAMGAVMSKMAKYGPAIKEYETALSLNAKSVDALMQLAKIKFDQRDYNMAREYYQRVLRQDQTRAEAHRQLGYIYRAIGQSRLAVESLKVYLELYPNAPDRARIEQEIDQLK
ncbi:MAG: tetratricopeptide repeat protein, partial [Pseudomonadota bacterium]